MDPRVKLEDDGGWGELCGKYSDGGRDMGEFRLRRGIGSFEVEDVAVRFTTALLGNITLQPCGLVNRAVFFQGFKQNPGKPFGQPSFSHDDIFQLPRLVEVRLARAVKAEDREPALAWNRLYPV
ncbi:hypothetical protein ACQY74_005679 [Rhizobium leguminosarum bv. trifolii]